MGYFTLMLMENVKGSLMCSCLAKLKQVLLCKYIFHISKKVLLAIVYLSIILTFINALYIEHTF